MYLGFKRIFDLSLAIFLLLLFLPLIIFTALLIYLKLGKPIFFVQRRLGKDNEVFLTYKFRSMKSKTNKLITDNSRMTPFGNFLRLSRLDELPQLFNIVKGDMSFIGPRPLLPEYLPYYSETEKKRHNVRPGLSGLSQIHNLNYPDWDVQMKDDVKYAENISFKMDFWILFKTIQRIFQVQKLAQSNANQRKSFIEFKKESNKIHL